jgi:DNA-directed RNA polymerase subunit RPC12/RpoP
LEKLGNLYPDGGNAAKIVVLQNPWNRLGMSEHQIYLCPTCGGEIEATAGQIAAPAACPHCGAMFVLPQAEESNQAGQSPSAEEELDGNRIRRLAMMRRSAYRSRSYCLIALGGCLGGAVEFIFHAVRIWRVRDGRGRVLYAILLILAAAALLAASAHLARLARRLHREANRSSLGEPAEKPDFSTLRDGSQMAKNLENIEGKPE